MRCAAINGVANVVLGFAAIYVFFHCVINILMQRCGS